MAAIFTFPLSQTLRFVNLNDKDEVQNLDNRFIKDLYYAKTLPYYYLQQVEQGDDLWVQFRTTYATKNIYLVGEDNIRVELSQTLLMTDSNGYSYYNVVVPVSGKTGCYFIEGTASDVDKPNALIQSEVFNISEESKNSIKIKWRGNLYGYDDQMDWISHSLYQFVRIDGRDREVQPEQNKTIYDDTDYAPSTLKSKPIRNVNIEVNKVPWWLIEKINIGLSHDEFLCQNVAYNTDNLIESEKLGDTMLYKASVVVTQLDFENGEDEEISGDIPIDYIAFNDTGDRMLFNNTGDYAKANN